MRARRRKWRPFVTLPADAGKAETPGYRETGGKGRLRRVGVPASCGAPDPDSPSAAARSSPPG